MSESIRKAGVVNSGQFSNWPTLASSVKDLESGRMNPALAIVQKTRIARFNTSYLACTPPSPGTVGGLRFRSFRANQRQNATRMITQGQLPLCILFHAFLPKNQVLLF